MKHHTDMAHLSTKQNEVNFTLKGKRRRVNGIGSKKGNKKTPTAYVSWKKLKCHYKKILIISSLLYKYFNLTY
jgi:hypothetical protein